MDEKIADVLDKVGLKSKGFKMPFEMSGGEQQRVDIARALLNSPKLILADEPTGNLDPETSDEIYSSSSRSPGTMAHRSLWRHMITGSSASSLPRKVKTERGIVIDNASVALVY